MFSLTKIVMFVYPMFVLRKQHVFVYSPVSVNGKKMWVVQLQLMGTRSNPTNAQQRKGGILRWQKVVSDTELFSVHTLDRQ